MIGIILFLNSRGDIILSRAFRDGFGIRQLADTFRLEVIATKKAERCPVTIINKVCFAHMRYDNMFIVACTNLNCDIGMVFQYMVRVLQAFKSYFEVINEDTLRDNFVTVQQVLDESMDHGYPQITEVDLLKDFITAGNVRSGAGSKKASEAITIKATGNIPWRKDNIVYRDNEVYLDVNEDVNLLMSQTGQVLQREVIGRVVMKSYLSGMPECRLTINDQSMLTSAAQQRNVASADDGTARQKPAVQLDDVTFHSCVQLGQFDTDRSICFVPPDGEFVLMRYRSSDNVAPPFRVVSARVKEVAKTRMEVDFHLKSEFDSKAVASHIVCKVPCPSSTASVKVRVNQGSAKYDATQKAIVWKLKRMASNAEIPFSCEIELIQSTLSQNDRVWSRPPIVLNFNLSMVAVSGLSVHTLRVNEPKLKYQASRWVRYTTNAGQYQCRL